jgi:hypothetical protein
MTRWNERTRVALRRLTVGAAAASIMIAGCVAPTAAVPPREPAGRFGWMADLAAACWHQNDFDADVCYWFASPADLYWFSRNQDGLLGCGKFTLPKANAARGSIFSWDDDGDDAAMTFALNADSLVTDQNAESPSGMTRRISRDSFSIQDRLGAAAMILKRKGPLPLTDAAIRQCLAWEARAR